MGLPFCSHRERTECVARVQRELSRLYRACNANGVTVTPWAARSTLQTDSPMLVLWLA